MKSDKYLERTLRPELNDPFRVSTPPRGDAPDGKRRLKVPSAISQEPADEEPVQQHDNVNHPAHYAAGGIECIDCIESMIAPIENPAYAFLTGQSLKYLARYTMKNGVEDLKKARWYLNRLIGKVAEDGTLENH